jgi:hypothetical protein
LWLDKTHLIFKEHASFTLKPRSSGWLSTIAPARDSRLIQKADCFRGHSLTSYYPNGAKVKPEACDTAFHLAIREMTIFEKHTISPGTILDKDLS